ncbi:hypothetical protein COLO4_13740 [Corchorus olitorius]|uniref:Uncharacterized protein n=1 Tax=Corchorus olitorius TaxID=93759 RepID=A0A1R3JVP1_9ROSI|nr:hypothetical protein COLO4_13740 [Corchorus olitorius]
MNLLEKNEKARRENGLRKTFMEEENERDCEDPLFFLEPIMERKNKNGGEEFGPQRGDQRVKTEKGVLWEDQEVAELALVNWQRNSVAQVYSVSSYFLGFYFPVLLSILLEPLSLDC